MSNEVFIDSAKKAIDWVVTQMMTDKSGSRGIYERLRIDLNERTVWVRPDCNIEFARLLSEYAKVSGDNQFNHIRDNIVEWLLSKQNLVAGAHGHGAFPFFFTDGITPDIDPAQCKNYWPNDSGKILRGLVQLYNYTGDKRLIEAAERMAGFFIRIMSEKGTFPQGEVFYDGPCFRMWPALGMAYLYQVTGNEKYIAVSKKVLDCALGMQLPSGRFRTSYEQPDQRGCSEDWRPVSSEVGISLKAYSEVGRITGDNRYLEAAEKAAGWMINAQHESGAISNYTPDSAGASLQVNPDITDLVYTCGYALIGMHCASNALNSKEVTQATQKLANFLAKIQCAGENEKWDGAWRGSYDFVKGEWAGRCDQNNDLDEGGMYSVYTGWCVAPIAYGLLLCAKQTDAIAL